MFYNTDETLEIERYGLTVKIRAMVDYDSGYALEWLGKYSNDWQPGAVDLYQGQYENSYRHDTYHYFIPETNVAETRAYMTKSGYSKHEAYTTAESYRLRDYERARQLENNHWCPVGLRVEVWHGDLQLGENSLYGLESDGEEIYFAEIAADCLSEAIAEAIKNVESLGGNADQLHMLDKLADRFFRRVYHFGDHKFNKRQNYIEKISRWRAGMVKDGIFGVYVYPSEYTQKQNGRKRSSFYFLGKRFGILS